MSMSLHGGGIGRLATMSRFPPPRTRADPCSPVRRPQLRARPFRVAEQQGSEGLAALALELALKLAEALERVASDDGLAAVDLVEVWLAD